MALDLSFQRSNSRLILLHEHHDAMYNGHVGESKTWKRLRVNYQWPDMQGSIKSYFKIL